MIWLASSICSGPMPQVADSETLTMEIVGGLLGFYADKDMFGFFRGFYVQCLPNPACRATFARHAANLWAVKESFSGISQTNSRVSSGQSTVFLYLFAGLPGSDFPGSSKMWPPKESALVTRRFTGFDCMR